MVSKIYYITSILLIVSVALLSSCLRTVNYEVYITELKSMQSEYINTLNCFTRSHYICIFDKAMADTVHCAFINDNDMLHGRIRIDKFWNISNKDNPSIKGGIYLNIIDSLYEKEAIVFNNHIAINQFLKYSRVSYDNFSPRDTNHILYKIIQSIDSIDTNGSQIFSNYHLEKWNAMLAIFQKNSTDTTLSNLQFLRLQQIITKYPKCSNNLIITQGYDLKYLKSTRYFYLYTIYPDEKNYLQVKKNLLNPEALLHLCE